MSKKLIAVASAAALALTGLVGVAPANATAPAIAITAIGANTGATAASPATVTVLRGNGVAAGSTGLAVELTNLVTGDVVRMEAAGGVRLLTGTFSATADADVSKLGTTDTTFTHSVGTTASYVAFTTSTSTTPGTVKMSVTRGTTLTATSTVYIQGVDPLKYNITEVTNVPATLAKLAKQKFSFKVTDINGNAVENASLGSVVTVGSAAAAAATWNSTTKTYEFEITSPSSSTFLVSVDLGASDIDGRPDANDTYVGVVNNTGVAAQITALTAQVATLTAQVAKRVSKKKYNTLARKWNAAFPSQKVALKK